MRMAAADHGAWTPSATTASRCPSCKSEDYWIVSEEEEENGTWVYTKRCMCGEEWKTVEAITAVQSI